MLPQQWSNPDYCFLEPASRVKPEQPHQMAVPTNHILGGCVIQLISYLIDMKNYRGFQGYSPFHFLAHWPAKPMSLSNQNYKVYLLSVDTFQMGHMEITPTHPNTATTPTPNNPYHPYPTHPYP